MKNFTKTATILLFSLCLSSVISVAAASWYSCEVSDNTTVNSGDYVCCDASIDEDDSVLTLTRLGSAHVVCTARNNKAWHWVYVGFENGCNKKFLGRHFVLPYNPHAYRCEQK
ncbi:MAG: hypothetical protein JSS53_00220 [Proteobacteria bacterium]|nr:hypothetical protein [Pseudomonadota bacterium]